MQKIILISLLVLILLVSACDVPKTQTEEDKKDDIFSSVTGNVIKDTLPKQQEAVREKQYSYDLSLCKGSAKCFIGTVKYIVDGDTLDVDEVRIRLVLTNTPEKDEGGFTEAKQFTANLCPVGSSVLVDEDDGQTTGSYGRTIAVVYCGNYNLNEQLLELDHGWIFTQYCKKSEFRNEDWAVKFGC